MKDFNSKSNNYRHANGVYWSNDMWLDNFATPEQEEDTTMHGKEAEFNYNPPVPAKYLAVSSEDMKVESKEDWYAMAEWRSRWRFEKNFEENYPVKWEGFESNTKDLIDMGWVITLEFNRATKKRKICFRNPCSGLMARVPFEFSDTCITLPKLYAVRNYKIKAAKYTEIVTDITEDFIPELLEWMREVTKNKVSEYVCTKKQKEAKEKIIDFGKYLHNQSEAA